MELSRDARKREQASLPPQVLEPVHQPEQARAVTEQATSVSSLQPRRIADRVLQIDERELSEISRQIDSGKLSVAQLLERIGLAPGGEVTLALPEERVVTLRRAGRGDVVWVDPERSVDLVASLVRGKIQGPAMRVILASSDTSINDHELAGYARQGVAFQGVLPKRDEYNSRTEWRKNALIRASVAVHELAHVQDDASEYVAYKRHYAFRARLGIEAMASPQELLDEIAHPLYTPQQIMRSVVDAARIENANMVTAERHDTEQLRWYGCTKGGACAVFLRALKEEGGWTLAVSRIPPAALKDQKLFNIARLQPIAMVTIRDADLRAHVAAHSTPPKDSEPRMHDAEATDRSGVVLVADRFMAQILEQSAETSHISRGGVHAVLCGLGLTKSRSPIVNRLFDLFGV